MLSRYIIRFGRSNLRFFAEAAQAAKAATPAPNAPVGEVLNLGKLEARIKKTIPAFKLGNSEKEVISEVTKDFNVIDFGAIPAFTLSNYDQQMEAALISLLNGLRSIQGGKGAVNFIEAIPVYSFLEYQPLANAAKVESLGNNQFKVSVLDPSNAPQVELAIQNSGFKLKTQRNLDIINVTMTIDKENTLKVAESLAEDARKKIDAVYQEGLKRFKGRNERGEKSIEVLKKKSLERVDELLAKKRDQFN